MSRLVILRGNSGSGKTTVAKMLQEKFGPNTMLISHDMIRMQILHGRRNSEITILEGILPYEDYKPLFEAALEEYGENIFSYYYDISFEETLRRHQTKPNRDEFGEADMRRWWREKDFLEVIPQTVLDEDVRLEEAVELIYGQVTA